MPPDEPVSGSPTRAGLIAKGSFILVVDDDPAMLELIGMVLGAHGWKVQGAADAETALRLVDAAPVPPVLAICDVILQGMDGLELGRRLLARVPRLRVIFLSAHLAEVSWWPFDLRQCPFLAKPFANDELIAAVREALSS
jgi:two-component system OmpR family response regulator